MLPVISFHLHFPITMFKMYPNLPSRKIMFVILKNGSKNNVLIALIDKTSTSS